MSNVRRNSLILFVGISLLGLILAPANFFTPGSNRPDGKYREPAPLKNADDSLHSPGELVVAPILPPAAPVAETKPSVANNAYPESTLFPKEKPQRQTVQATRTPAYYAEDEHGADPMLASRPTVARHVSKREIVVDTPIEPIVLSDDHLSNGRHLTRRFTHIIEDGDSLELIAERYLWDKARARDVFEENRNVLTSMTELPIGRTIVIPERR